MEPTVCLFACLFGVGQAWGISEEGLEQVDFFPFTNQSEWITAKRLLHFVLVDITEVWNRFTCISEKRQKSGKQGNEWAYICLYDTFLCRIKN